MARLGKVCINDGQALAKTSHWYCEKCRSQALERQKRYNKRDKEMSK